MVFLAPFHKAARPPLRSAHGPGLAVCAPPVLPDTCDFALLKTGINKPACAHCPATHSYPVPFDHLVPCLTPCSVLHHARAPPGLCPIHGSPCCALGQLAWAGPAPPHGAPRRPRRIPPCCPAIMSSCSEFLVTQATPPRGVPPAPFCRARYTSSPRCRQSPSVMVALPAPAPCTAASARYPASPSSGRL